MNAEPKWLGATSGNGSVGGGSGEGRGEEEKKKKKTIGGESASVCV